MTKIRESEEVDTKMSIDKDLEASVREEKVKTILSIEETDARVIKDE